MSEDRSKLSLIKGNDPCIGSWVSFSNINEHLKTFGFGKSFKEAEYNIHNNIHDEEKEKHMIERFKQ